MSKMSKKLLNFFVTSFLKNDKNQIFCNKFFIFGKIGKFFEKSGAK
mgnify:CR=1 FL=1